HAFDAFTLLARRAVPPLEIDRRRLFDAFWKSVAPVLRTLHEVGGTLRRVERHVFPALSFTGCALGLGPGVGLLARFEGAGQDEGAVVGQIHFDAVPNQTYSTGYEIAVATQFPERRRLIVHTSSIVRHAVPIDAGGR